MNPPDAKAIYADPAFAGRYARHLGEIDHPAFYERKATLALLGEVRGKRVLDAGCGPGVYSLHMARQGAAVTALDSSKAMLDLLRHRAKKQKLTLLQADLEGPLPLADNSFDIVLCAMVLQHLRDWAPVLREFARVLDADGRLVLSTTHPFADLLPEADYFEVAPTAEDWPAYGIEMPCFRRSFAAIFADLARAGLVAETLLEPQSPDQDPFIRHQPWVLCLRIKNG